MSGFFWLTVLLRFVCNGALKYASDNSMTWLAFLVSLVWMLLTYFWYHIYQEGEKYIIITVYYILATAITDIVLSQVFFKEVLLPKQWLGIFLAFLSVMVMSK